MRKIKLNQCGELMIGNRKSLFFSAFLFLVGISAGVFVELSMSDADKLMAAEFLSQYLHISQGSGPAISYPNPFLSGAGSNLFLLLLIMLSGLSVIGFPAAHIVVIYKGVALGFSAGLILESFAARGAAALCLSMVPQNLLLIPAFILAAAAAQNHGIALLSQRVKKQKKTGVKSNCNLNRYFSAYIILALAVLAGCLIEGLIFPFLK